MATDVRLDTIRQSPAEPLGIAIVGTYPDAGVGVVCGKHLSGIDIDTDDPVIKGAVISVLPSATVKKKGAKGETWLYQGFNTDKSVSWRINKKTVCDFIGPGRQTVLPPTVHHDTKQPYVWTGAETLEGVEPRELPDDIFERIGEALKPFGWTPEPNHTPSDEHSERGEYDGETLPRMVNNEALDRLDDWVPYLGLEKLRKTSEGYVAVAHWRPSNRGRPLAERSPNLGISFRGIVDFGDSNKGYRPF